MSARHLLALVAATLVFAGSVVPATAQTGGDAPAATGSAASSASGARRGSALVDLEDEVMCIVCKRPLATSGGDAADEERSVIQGYLDQGLSKDQVKDRLVAEYGEKVLVTGSTPVTAAAPVLVAAIGCLSVALVLRRRRRRDDAQDPEGASTSGGMAEPDATVDESRTAADDDARIDAELAERG